MATHSRRGKNFQFEGGFEFILDITVDVNPDFSIVLIKFQKPENTGRLIRSRDVRRLLVSNGEALSGASIPLQEKMEKCRVL